MARANLEGKTIAFSVSDSPDLTRLGISPRALEHVMIEIARYILRAGGVIAYGGDLRESGFTMALFEMVRRYRRDHSEAPPVHNYLAWSVHQKYEGEFLQKKIDEYAGIARITLLTPEGDSLRLEERERVPVTPELAAVSLEGMRHRMTAEISARVCLGGKVRDFSGRFPGLAEEAAMAIQGGRRLLLVGGFGGCTRDLAATLGFGEGWPERHESETGEFTTQYRQGLELVSTMARNSPKADIPESNLRLANERNLPRIIRGVVQALQIPALATATAYA
jgi:hypothetical protein